MYKVSQIEKLIGVTIFIALLGGTFMVPAASARSGGIRGVGEAIQTWYIPTLEYPKGTVHVDNLMYLWVAVSSATEYQLQVRDSSLTNILNDYYDSTDCSAGTCLAQPGDILSDDDYSWRMRAYVSGTWKDWSSYQSFTVDTDGTGTGFHSNFNSNHSGWSILKGSWSHVSSSYFKTAGAGDQFSSIKHSGSYTTLTYEVKMKRDGCGGCSNAIIIRGNGVTAGKGWWTHEYVFNYNKNGLFSVWKTDENTPLKNWTTTTHINNPGWNTLKVTASGSQLKFYINGHLVWQGSSSTYPSGNVGIGMYRSGGSSGNSFLLDWADLSTSVPDLGYDEVIDDIQVELTGGNINEGP